jgi:hypothetical protein
MVLRQLPALAKEFDVCVEDHLSNQ